MFSILMILVSIVRGFGLDCSGMEVFFWKDNISWRRFQIRFMVCIITWLNFNPDRRHLQNKKPTRSLLNDNFRQRNWVFATNSDFLITISLEPNVTDLRYFKLWILLNQIIRVWNIKGLQHRFLKILGLKYLISLQRLNSFLPFSQDKNIA